MTPRVVLQTQRLVLREMSPDDIEFIAPLLADPEVMRFWPRPYTFEEAEEWIERQLERYGRDACGYWLALMNGNPVGQAGLLGQEVGSVSEVGLGYIFAKEFWGRGLATEAARACLAYGLRDMELPRVVCLVRPENDASKQVAERLGMAEERRVEYAGYEHALYVSKGMRKWLPHLDSNQGPAD